MGKLEDIIKIIDKLDNEKDLKDFLLGILTASEIEQINTRLEIIRLLKKGVSQHEIADRLGVGVVTVSRGAKMLKEGHFSYV